MEIVKTRRTGLFMLVSHTLTRGPSFCHTHTHCYHWALMCSPAVMKLLMMFNRWIKPLSNNEEMLYIYILTYTAPYWITAATARMIASNSNEEMWLVLTPSLSDLNLLLSFLVVGLMSELYNSTNATRACFKKNKQVQFNSWRDVSLTCFFYHITKISPLEPGSDWVVRNLC